MLMTPLTVLVLVVWCQVDMTFKAFKRGLDEVYEKFKGRYTHGTVSP